MFVEKRKKKREENVKSGGEPGRNMTNRADASSPPLPLKLTGHKGRNSL